MNLMYQAVWENARMETISLYNSALFFSLASFNSFCLLMKSKFSHSSHECLSCLQLTDELADCLIRHMLYNAK